MMEKDVKISARAKDVAVAQKAAKDAAAEFEKQAGYAVKVEVDGELAAGWLVLSPWLVSSSETEMFQCDAVLEVSNSLDTEIESLLTTHSTNDLDCSRNKLFPKLEIRSLDRFVRCPSIRRIIVLSLYHFSSHEQNENRRVSHSLLGTQSVSFVRTNSLPVSTVLLLNTL